ncbi:MAG: hypothetical protein IPN86_13865 [Saprospiraceae bacterium]|nr:hypothetical protein [Saprospiraceae bacterium]
MPESVKGLLLISKAIGSVKVVDVPCISIFTALDPLVTFWVIKLAMVLAFCPATVRTVLSRIAMLTVQS